MEERGWGGGGGGGGGGLNREGVLINFPRLKRGGGVNRGFMAF